MDPSDHSCFINHGPTSETLNARALRWAPHRAPSILRPMDDLPEELP